jgi:hypothetical protein
MNVFEIDVVNDGIIINKVLNSENVNLNTAFVSVQKPDCNDIFTASEKYHFY